jgi:hypothetical protein
MRPLFGHDRMRVTAADWDVDIGAAHPRYRTEERGHGVVVEGHLVGDVVRPLSPTRRRQLILAAGPATIFIGLAIAVVVGLVTRSFLWAIAAGLLAGVGFTVLGVALMLIFGGTKSRRLHRR